MVHSGLRPEAALLLAASRAEPTPEDVAAVRSHITEGGTSFDWAWLIEQAYTHRVIFLVARSLAEAATDPEVGEVLAHYGGLFQWARAANASRNEILLEEMGVILRAFDTAGIPVVIRKGPVLLQEIYHDVSLRQMNDLDLMLEPDDVQRAQHLLVELGYAKGRPSANRRVLKPLPRDQQIYARLKVPNVLLYRPASGRFRDWFIVDISLDMFLPDAPWSLPSGALAERSQPIRLYGAPARRLLPDEMLIDLTTHLYKEATTLHYVHARKDLTLCKFVDVAEWACRGGVDWGSFTRKVADFGIAKPVYYALHFTDVLFPGCVPASTLDSLRPVDTAYLAEIGADEGQPYRWQSEFLDRLFDGNRLHDVPRSKAVL